jgi:hypothetical protein
MRALFAIGNLPLRCCAAIVLLLLAAGQPAAAQESRGAAGYSPTLLAPAKPGLDAEEAFRIGDRRRLKMPVCDKPDSPPDCKPAAKYVEEYNRAMEALESKFRQ